MPRTYIVTGHAPAAEWIVRQGVSGTTVPHLDPAIVASGDTVVGTLPVHLAQEVCARGGRFVALVIDRPRGLRGHDLTVDDLERLGARLIAYKVEKLPDEPYPRKLVRS